MVHAILNPNVGFDLPTWADEGAAVLGSSEHDRDRFDDLMHRYYSSDHFIPLERLFRSKTYLPDWVMLYAEGYSITSFLVKARDRKTFLAFVASGQRDGWDRAVKQHYGYPSVAMLERAWLQSLSWTGKRIVTRNAGVKLAYTDSRSGKVIELATLDRGIYTVLKEKGDWIKIRHRGVAGWLAKDDAVLLENAVGHFTQRIRLLQQDSHAFAYRGLAWLEKGDATRAVTDLNTAIELAPDHAAWYVYRGKAHIRNDEYRRAIADFAEAVSRVARLNRDKKR
jgi:tetratricopeptide (TPR) repeat protein